MKYQVEITETLQKTVEVEAESERDAISKVEDQYYNNEIELDTSDFIDTIFEIIS